MWGDNIHQAFLCDFRCPCVHMCALIKPPKQHRLPAFELRGGQFRWKRKLIIRYQTCTAVFIVKPPTAPAQPILMQTPLCAPRKCNSGRRPKYFICAPKNFHCPINSLALGHSVAKRQHENRALNLLCICWPL